MKNIYFIFLTLLLSSCALVPTTKSVNQSTQTTIIAPREQVEAHGTKWAVSTQGIHTTRIAADVLRSGGNLIDAAIAASFAISVERPHSTGLGGGGFLIYHEAKTGKDYVYDFRERAPLQATKRMYLDQKGEVIPDLSVNGALAVGAPGLVRGLSKVHQRFGKSPWKKLVTPSQKLALNGFTVYRTLEKALKEKRGVLNRFPSSRQIFFHSNGGILKQGDLLIQADLAKTLGIVAHNPEDFYSGRIARKIIASIQKEKGILSLADLKTYPVKERKAIRAHWKGYEIVTMPPPSSGGIHVAQILKQIENDSLHFLEPPTLHLMASSMQSAYADRAEFLGDPDFTKVPVTGLLNSEYLAKRRGEFNINHARTKKEVLAGNAPSYEDPSNTTHFSFMDADGNVVVSTQTINGYFGSGLVADGTGIVLNNEMDDFAAKAGAPNIFGALGGDANAVAPKKTPLSSMSPTIVLQGKTPILAVGAPGGTRIITSVVQTILNHLEFKKDLYTSVATSRIHQQWSPDVLFIEDSATPGLREEITPETIVALEKIGWKIERAPAQCHIMAVSRIQKPDGSFELVGVADPRDIGTSAGE
jgi:gamma-glutamyltranspeptidase/glutathione hydrolase